MKNLSNEVSVSSTSVSQWALWSCCWPDIESNKAQGQGPASRKPPCCSPHHSNWRQRTEWGPEWMNERTNLSLKRKETLMLIRGEVYGTYDTLEWGWFWYESTEFRQRTVGLLSWPYGCGRTHSPPVCTHGSEWWAADYVCLGSPLWHQGPSSSLHPSPRWVCIHPESSGHSTAGPGSGGAKNSKF